MFKYVIAVVFLSSVALGQNLGEWDPDAQAYCLEKCLPYCPNCTEPVRCTADENFCGKEPVDPNMSQCTTNDICVPKPCECDQVDDNGDFCERICEVTCQEDQIKCGVKDTVYGCKSNDICVHKGFSNDNIELCDGFCTVYCEDDELICPKDPLDNGCRQAEDCVPKQKDHDNNICPNQQCPLTCKDTEHLCEGAVDVYGCKEDDECVLKDTSNTGDLCPGTCPVECTNSQILCNGQIDYSDTILQGCVGQDICHTKAKDDEGVYCPPDSASHECPKACPQDEVLCPPYDGPLGCKGPYVCETRSKDDMDQYCPSTADCPVHCKQDEYPCPTGEDENGCKLPDECVKTERGFDGELCPLHCPELCTDEQVFCRGGIDETGCRGPSSCRDKTRHQWGEGYTDSDPPRLCPGYCPTQCESHEILCPSQVDPCNGCPTEEVCREAIKDKDGIFCPGKEEQGLDVDDTSLRRGGFLSFSHNCPKLCREQEPFGEVLCPTYEDDKGCKPEAECRERTTGTDGEYCPAYSVCDKQCPKGFKLCEYETVDENGCKVEPSCVYKGKNNINLYCPGHCPPLCSGGQELVSSGVDADGCALPSACESSR